MHFVQSNENGRIYIKKFAIEKLVYKLFNDNAKKLSCYYVTYDQSVITIYLHEQAGVDIEALENIQVNIRKFLRNELGLYVEKVNINLG